MLREHLLILASSMTYAGYLGVQKPWSKDWGGLEGLSPDEFGKIIVGVVTVWTVVDVMFGIETSTLLYSSPVWSVSSIGRSCTCRGESGNSGSGGDEIISSSLNANIILEGISRVPKYW